MTFARRAVVLVLLLGVCGVSPCLAQTATITTRPVLTAPEMEAFLLHARIIDTVRTLKGVTGARQVTLSDGRITHDAQVQDVDIYKAIFEVGPKYTEVNFRDTYRYNIAAYRLAQLLGLDNVPMSVLRTVNGKPAAVTWWLDDVAMEEGDRQKMKPVPVGPNPARTAGYIHILRVFDELIQNRDRNAGNFIWTKDWTMWMVDHTRAFRLGKNLLKPELLQRCERSLCEHMRTLTAPVLAEVMGRSLTPQEIDALLARRDVIVKLFEDKIAQLSEPAVMYTLVR
jgi:hypothetical protein